MILFLIRHGQTVANLEGFYSGQSDVKLTELGLAQAEAIRPILANYHFDRVYSSDLSRAVDTAKLAIPGCAPIQTPLLREISIGDLTGQSIASVRERYGNLKGNFTPWNGEDQDLIIKRAEAFLRQLESDPAEYVAAFTHNGYMKAVLQAIMGKFNTAPMTNGNCNIAVLKYTNGHWTLNVWNLAGII